MTIHASAFVHPLALVENSEVGAGTRIWQFASVIRGTRLGANCNVAHGACLDGPKFGDRCIISHNVAMGPGFVVGDDVFIGPGVVFCNDVWPTTAKDGWDLKKFQDGFCTVRVHDGASIGANAVLLPGITLGMCAVIAAGAVVDRDVPTGMLFRRSGEIVPAKPAIERTRMREARTL